MQIFQFVTTALAAVAYNRTRLTKNATLHRAYNATVRCSNRFIDCARCAGKTATQARVKQAVKPERTHHCSVCKQCNLKMDHHCPFVQNCVGLHNHRFFVQMLIYGFVGGVVSLLQIASYLKYELLDVGVDVHSLTMYLWAVAIILLSALQVSYVTVCMFMGSKQFRLVARNLNTLEDMKVHHRDLYDLGTLSNLKDFFRDWPRALLPIKARLRYEGYFFHMRGEDPEFQTVVFHPDFLAAADPLESAGSTTLRQLIEGYQEVEARSRKQAGGTRVYIFNNTKIQE